MKAKKKTEKPVTAPRIELMHGNYRIIAGKKDGEFHALAYIGRTLIAQVSAEDIAEAITRVKATVDARQRSRLAARADGVPATEEYLEAFAFGTLVGKISPTQAAMLKAHLHAKDQTVTVRDLAVAGRCADAATADGLYAKLGRLLSNYLQYAPSMIGMKAQLRPILTLAAGEVRGSDGLWSWRMRPEVVAALHEADL